MLTGTAREMYEIEQRRTLILVSDMEVGPYWVIALSLFPRIPKAMLGIVDFPLRG